MVAIIEPSVFPREVSIRIARAFASSGCETVCLCHWHCLEWEDSDLNVSGSVHFVNESGKLSEVRLAHSRTATSLFFYAPRSGYLAPNDAAAQQRLAPGMKIANESVFDFVDGVLLEASRRGVVTNALGDGRSWGAKHLQEIHLRSYEAATGDKIPRPKTYIAHPPEFHYVLSLFAQRGETCVVKPVFGQGGEGIAIVQPGEFCPVPFCPVVVQHLIPAPLLVERNKVDLRCYLLIDTSDENASRRIGPILVRRALVEYWEGSRPAEITNTAYRSRLGIPPDVRLLENVSSIGENTRREIVDQVDSIAISLTRAFFWHARNKLPEQPLVGNRVLLFGIDVLVAAMPEIHAFYLESNPLPQLFRGVAECDSAVEAMLSREYWPALAPLAAHDRGLF